MGLQLLISRMYVPQAVVGRRRVCVYVSMSEMDETMFQQSKFNPFLWNYTIHIAKLERECPNDDGISIHCNHNNELFSFE